MNILPQREIARPQFDMPGAEHFIKIPDGEYVASVIDSISGFVIGSPRLLIGFRIEDDIGDERRIYAYYKVKELSKNGRVLKSGERKRRPEFSMGWRCRLARDLGTLFSEYGPDYLPIRVPLIDLPVRILTRTVLKDIGGRKRPENFHSSVVDQILGWAE